MKKMRILIVDDEESVIFTFKELLREYELTTCTNPKDALTIVKSGKQFDIVLMDLRMHGISGIDLLTEIKKCISGSYKAVLITAFSSKELLEKGLNEELFQKVVNKPFEESQIIDLIQNISTQLEKERNAKNYFSVLETSITNLATSFGQTKPVLVHSCQKMKDLLENIRKISDSDANVFLEGETGVGKEIIASLIHCQSKRSQKPFIKINCAAIPEHLFESEVFGHKKGSFTGAMVDKPGKFQLADGGTLFLDEIGELPLLQQAKLLRVIEDSEICPVGATASEKVDVRIISATNRCIHEMIENKQFRYDLHYRLNILSLYIPPLRERKEDIPILTAYFLSEIANKEGQVRKIMEEDCFEYLKQIDFSGNVRELRNLVYRVYAMSNEDVITLSDIKDQYRSFKNGNSKVHQDHFEKSMTLSDLESEYINYQLEKHDYFLTETARVLGMEVSNLSRKLSNMGISIRKLKMTKHHN